MPRKSVRHPFRNFFLKKRLQLQIFFTVLGMVLVTSIFTTVILAIIYNAKAKGGNFFYMSNNVMQDLELTSILGLVLPALIAAQAVTLIIGAGVGLFSSRKAAVPVYKLEKWASQIKKGHLKTQLGFREENSMKDLEIQCNALSDSYLHTFKDIDTALRNIEEDNTYKSPLTADSVLKIRRSIDWIDF